MVATLALILFLFQAPAVSSSDDRNTISEPKERRLSRIYEGVTSSVFAPFAKVFDIPRHFRKLSGDPKEAENVNAMDEVPDSSWFTNRNFFKPVSMEIFQHGLPLQQAPDSGPWTITKCKTNGVSPGFQIRDAKGDA